MINRLPNLVTAAASLLLLAAGPAVAKDGIVACRSGTVAPTADGFKDAIVLFAPEQFDGPLMSETTKKLGSPKVIQLIPTDSMSESVRDDRYWMVFYDRDIKARKVMLDGKPSKHPDIMVGAMMESAELKAVIAGQLEASKQLACAVLIERKTCPDDKGPGLSKAC